MDSSRQRSRRRASPRRPSRHRRRRRLLVPVAVAAIAIALIVAIDGNGGGDSPAAAPEFETTAVARPASNQLPAPISGEAVVAMPGGPLILGGLDSASGSVSGVFQLDPASGQLREEGALGGPLHDAAAVALG